MEVGPIHDEMGYQQLRSALSAQYNLSNHEPNIQVYDVDVRGDRSLTLRYVPQGGIPLAASKQEVIKHLYRLWGFKVKLEQVDENGNLEQIAQCPEEESES